MLAVRTRYDGKDVRIPQAARPPGPCNVIVLFEEDESFRDAEWLKLQEKNLAKAWDNEEDAVYDRV